MVALLPGPYTGGDLRSDDLEVEFPSLLRYFLCHICRWLYASIGRKDNLGGGRLMFLLRLTLVA